MVRINLLPIRTILRRRELKQFIVIAAAILVAAVLIGVAAGFYVNVQHDNLQRQLGALQTKLAELKKKNKEIEDLKSEIARLQKQVDTIQKLTKTRVSPAPFLGAVSLAVPDEVWITSLSQQGNSFSLDGVGADNTVVVNFVQQLLKIRKDFTVEKPFVDPKNPQDPTFFSDVKLLQIVAQSKPGGLSNVSFKIVGSTR